MARSELYASILLGSNPFTTSVLIATTFATSVSAHKVIGNIGKSYQLGVAFAATLFLVPIGWFVMARLLGNNLDFFHQKKFMTLGDIMEHWYGKLGRHITSVASIIITLGVTATGCMAIGKLGNYFFGIPELLFMIIALSVVTIYATFGGFTAVAITDVFQFIIFFIAIPVAFVIGLDEVGGYTNILKSLPESHLTMQSKDIALFASLAVFALIPNTTVPFVQRALVARNKSQLVKTFTSTALLMIPLYILVALIGFMTYIKNPNLQTDTVLFYFIKHYLFAGVVGFMIAGLLAVIMSTQDSFLNTTSALIASDICKKIWPSLSVKKELIIARVSCVLLAILSVFLLLDVWCNKAIYIPQRLL